MQQCIDINAPYLEEVVGIHHDHRIGQFTSVRRRRHHQSTSAALASNDGCQLILQMHKAAQQKDQSAGTSSGNRATKQSDEEAVSRELLKETDYPPRPWTHCLRGATQTTLR